MTEAEDTDVVSVCKILAAMCCLTEKMHTTGILTDRKQLGLVACALLAESVSREARVVIYSKTDKPADVVHALLVKALDISNDFNQDTEFSVKPIFENSFSLDKAKSASGRFFAKFGTTNCPPQAVFSCLSFVEAVEAWCTKEGSSRGSLTDQLKGDCTEMYDFILDAYANVSMGSFIEKYVHTCGSQEKNAVVDATHVQIALYIQGLQYHTSKTRRVGLPSISDPLPIIQAAAVHVRSVFYDRAQKEYVAKLRAQMAAGNRAVQVEFQRQEQLVYLQVHAGLPKLFSQAEVNALNLNRPLNDQLSLVDPSGLLKHHCAYQMCPLYLVNLSTVKDKLDTKRRRGLFRHLKLHVYPERRYLAGFHVNATLIFKRLRSKTVDFSSESFYEALFDVYKDRMLISKTLFQELSLLVWNELSVFSTS